MTERRKVVVHDLSQEEFQQVFPDIYSRFHIICDNGSIKNCIGCFGCWIKTPGQCVIKDGYDIMGEILARAEAVTIISRCVYGGYSPFIKNIWDRSISYILPFFKTKNNETHHKRRYKDTFCLSVYFYGEHITSQEIAAARNLVKANCRNFYIEKYNVEFFQSIEELERECGL